MSAFVVDASVGIKWYVPEVYDADAGRLQVPAHQLHVPTFFDVETANILWKKKQRGELSRVDADDILAKVIALPLIRHPEAPLLPAAFDLADRLQRTVYDSLYLALAIQLGAKMVTADLRLYNALQGTPEAAHICWIEDVP
jgi:predicted nucleic acid-binding protein